MVDLSQEIADLWRALGAPAAGRPRVIQVIAARPGEGASTVACELARYAAQRAGRRTWLVDLDLAGASQYAAISDRPNSLGQLGEAVSASPDGSAFFTVRPAQPGLFDAAYLAAHQVGSHKWWVTRFRRELLKGRQGVHVLQSGDYWQALRQHAEIVVVDCPPPSRSQAGLSLAPYMDDTVLVVAADEPDVLKPAQLRDAINAAGGKCTGVFFNRAKVKAPGFLKAVLP